MSKIFESEHQEAADRLLRAYNRTGSLRVHSGYGRCASEVAPVVFPLRAVATSSFCSPISIMGQYFKAVNMDKKEYVCPWCIGGVAKLIEWAANPQGAIFTMLLRKSSASGGGDYYGPASRDICLGSNEAENVDLVMHEIFKGVAMEGRPVSPSPDTTVGRWAGDRVALVGDYDESKLWEELGSWKNISAEVVRDWNAFVDIPDLKLRLNPDCSCRKGET